MKNAKQSKSKDADDASSSSLSPAQASSQTTSPKTTQTTPDGKTKIPRWRPNKQAALMGTIVLVSVLTGFAIGSEYQRNQQRSSSVPTRHGYMHADGMYGGRDSRFSKRGSMGTMATVSAITDTSITLQRGSGTQTFTIAETTDIYNSDTEAKASDIKPGDRVLVRAKNGVATRIDINPIADDFGSERGGSYAQ